jgi:hypothetical protein
MNASKTDQWPNREDAFARKTQKKKFPITSNIAEPTTFSAAISMIASTHYALN